MANKEQVRMLKEEGVEAWNKWRMIYILAEIDLRESDLRRTELREADLIEADLIEANLSEANLIRANLIGADLRGADLSWADLREADLTNANLNAANLTAADLNLANLRFANLTEADLTNANLRFANLDTANLSQADLEGTILGHTVFGVVNLFETKNLESCKHFHSSIIDDETLQRSGPLPMEFLKGCGLSDWQIEAAKLHQSDLSDGQVTDICYKIVDLRTDQALQFYSGFISYGHSDRVFANKLHDDLQKKGIRCWLDEHQLLPGDDIYEQVDRGIRLWDKILLCCSESSLTSWWVDNEIRTGFKKEQKLMKEQGEKVHCLIPLDLDGFIHSDECQNPLKTQIRERVVADFKSCKTRNPKYKKNLEKVVAAMNVQDTRLKPPPSLL